MPVRVKTAGKNVITTSCRRIAAVEWQRRGTYNILFTLHYYYCNVASGLGIRIMRREKKIPNANNPLAAESRVVPFLDSWWWWRWW